MLDNIKSKKSFAAIMTLAFAALVTCGVADTTYAEGTASGVINLSGNTSTQSASSTADSTTAETTESTIPTTSAGTTTTNPETADDTWLYALASLAITATALGGRHYFAKH